MGRKSGPQRRADRAERLLKSQLEKEEKLKQLGINPSNSSVLNTSVVNQRIVGKNRPDAGLLSGGSAWNRKSAGLADFLTFGVWDFDQRGNLGGGEHKAGGIFNRPGSGFGRLQEGTEKDGSKIVLQDDYEYIDPLDPDKGTQKKGTRDAEELEKEIAAETRKEELGTRLANQNLFRAQLAAIPDIMLRGGEGVAKIYGDQAANTLQWAANLPKYNLPAMNYTALRDYGLG
jgi:hypothetical protein